MKLSAVAVAAALLIMPAFSASGTTVPVLSGTYVYSSNTFCQLDVVTKYATSKAIANTSFVATITAGGGNNTVALSAGTLTFTPPIAGTSGGGKATISGWEIDGSSILLTSTGAGTSGTGGAALASDAQSGTATFAQTATTLKLTEGSTVLTYHIYYGKVTNGIAQFATFIGTDNKGCAERYTLTHD